MKMEKNHQAVINENEEKKTKKEKKKEKNKIKEEKTKNLQKGMMNVAQTTRVDLSILSSAVRMSHANHAKMK